MAAPRPARNSPLTYRGAGQRTRFAETAMPDAVGIPAPFRAADVADSMPDRIMPRRVPASADNDIDPE